jgi:hypothetical protein
MAGHPYINERQTEYWTSQQVEMFFGDLGYDVLSLPITQLTESKLPADFLCFDGSLTKLFGLQYKALYTNDFEYWPLNKDQHSRLQLYPWVYYCLCELRDIRDRRSALHSSRILATDFPYQEQIPVRRGPSYPFYMRWGAFYEGLKQCRRGIRVASPDEVIAAVFPEGDQGYPSELRRLAVEAILVELEQRRVVRYSPFVSIPSPD